MFGKFRIWWKQPTWKEAFSPWTRLHGHDTGQWLMTKKKQLIWFFYSAGSNRTWGLGTNINKPRAWENRVEPVPQHWPYGKHTLPVLAWENIYEHVVQHTLNASERFNDSTSLMLLATRAITKRSQPVRTYYACAAKRKHAKHCNLKSTVLNLGQHQLYK